MIGSLTDLPEMLPADRRVELAADDEWRTAEHERWREFVRQPRRSIRDSPAVLNWYRDEVNAFAAHFGRIAATTLETLAWVGLATALVAFLNSVATAAGLGSIYLIAVLAVAIRRGQVAALAAAVLGVLTLNFFFIKPLHQLTIADSDNVVALGVLLLAALVVGRLAGQVSAASRRGRAARRAGRRAGARGGDARRCRDRAARRDR